MNSFLEATCNMSKEEIYMSLFDLLMTFWNMQTEKMKTA